MVTNKQSDEMKIQLLSVNDSDDLLAFETLNRSWFERFIVGRDESFYSPSQINAHLNDCLAEYARGVMWPALIKNRQDDIIGRANLRHIEQQQGHAEIGYRVAQSAIGQGVATFAVLELIKIARDLLGLNQITARVLHNNPASQKVLQKAGFTKTAVHLRVAQVNGHWLDAGEYQRLL